MQDSKSRAWFVVPIAIATLVAFRVWIGDTAWVPSSSMHPTLVEGDLLYINRLASLHRCDVIVFHEPQSGSRMVKRVMAFAGETVQFVDGILTVNGEAVSRHFVEGDELRERYEERGLCDSPIVVQMFKEVPHLRDLAPHRVPADHVFVLGDARDDSVDSREFGDVMASSIVGRVDAVLVSLDPEHTFRPRGDRFFASLTQL